jgi:hypothetical protein
MISKSLIKKKNHVTYIRSEKEILTKVANNLDFFINFSKIEHPFVVNLKFAFHSEKKLFLVFSSILKYSFVLGHGFSRRGGTLLPPSSKRIDFGKGFPSSIVFLT